MLIRLLLAFAVRRDLTVRGQGQAIQTLTSKYKEKRGTISFKSNQEYTDGRNIEQPLFGPFCGPDFGSYVRSFPDSL